MDLIDDSLSRFCRGYLVLAYDETKLSKLRRGKLNIARVVIQWRSWQDPLVAQLISRCDEKRVAPSGLYEPVILGNAIVSGVAAGLIPNVRMLWKSMFVFRRSIFAGAEDIVNTWCANLPLLSCNIARACKSVEPFYWGALPKSWTWLFLTSMLLAYKFCLWGFAWFDLKARWKPYKRRLSAVPGRSMKSAQELLHSQALKKLTDASIVKWTSIVCSLSSKSCNPFLGVTSVYYSLISYVSSVFFIRRIDRQFDATNLRSTFSDRYFLHDGGTRQTAPMCLVCAEKMGTSRRSSSGNETALPVFKRKNCGVFIGINGWISC